MRAHHQVRAAMTAIVIVTPVAAWVGVGDRSEEYGYHRALPVIPVPTWPGLLAALVMVVAVVTVGVAARSGAPWVEEVRATIPLVAAGIVAAGGWRIASSETVGANIGAGMAIFVGPPVVAALVVSGARRWWRIGRRGRPRHVDPPAIPAVNPCRGGRWGGGGRRSGLGRPR